MKKLLTLLLSLILSGTALASEQVLSTGFPSGMPATNGAIGYKILTHDSGFSSSAQSETAPFDFVLRRFRVDIAIAPGSGKSYTFTLYQNGSPTSASCVIADSGQTCSSNVEVSVSAGDNIYLQSLCTGNPTSNGASWVVARISTVSPNYSIYGANSLLFNTNSTRYTNFIYGSTASSLESNTEYALIPTNGQISNLYVNVVNAPGSGQSLVYTLRVNSVDTAMTCTISNSGTTCNDTSHTLTLVKGDIVSLKVVASTTAATGNFAHTLAFRSDQANLFFMSGGYLSDSSPNIYSKPNDMQSDSTEGNMKVLGGNYIFRSLYFQPVSAPGTGATKTITLRKNSTSDSSLTCTASDTDTFCETIADVTSTEGDFWGMKAATTGSPASSHGRFSVVAEVVHTNTVGKATIGKAHF